MTVTVEQLAAMKAGRERQYEGWCDEAAEAVQAWRHWVDAERRAWIAFNGTEDESDRAALHAAWRGIVREMPRGPSTAEYEAARKAGYIV